MNRPFLRVSQIVAITGLLLGITAPLALAGPGVLYIDSGSVSIKRAWWLRFSDTYNGVELGGRDQIRAASGSSAELRCPDSERRVPVPAGTTRSVNSLCNTDNPIYRPYEALTFGDLRGGSDPALPYVLAPRTGAVLDATPTVSWNPVEGATRYTVRMEERIRRNQKEPDRVLWELETSETQIEYPTDSAPLESRVFYSVVVETDVGQSSSKEASERQSFRLVAKPELAEQLSEIEALGLPLDVETVRKASLYMESDFYSAVIHMLKKSIAEQGNSSRVLQALGNAYLASGLQLLAEKAYLEALSTALLYQDLEDWTMTQVTLGELYGRVEHPERAIQRLRQAQLGAFFVCDLELMEQVQGTLNGLTGEEQPVPSCVPLGGIQP
ncbi:MAG: hypothetical protein F6K19_32285 [Cyanothece sp. SIO1E1]|nr:hypothetical protein [Cyanothece sp. SIO1E1]